MLILFIICVPLNQLYSSQLLLTLYSPVSFLGLKYSSLDVTFPYDYFLLILDTFQARTLIGFSITFTSFSSSSTIRLRPLDLFLPPGNLPISLVVFLYLFSLQVCYFFFWVVYCHPFFVCVPPILYCVNLSLILNMRNCYLMSLFLLLSKSVYPADGLKNLISAAQCSSCLIGLGTSPHCHTSE